MLATFPVKPCHGCLGIEAVRLQVIPENVAYVASQGVAAMLPAMGLPFIEPASGMPTWSDPTTEPEWMA